MKIKLFTLAALMFGLVIATAFGQGARGIRHYDPKTEATIKGTVEEVQQPAGMGGSSGTHLMLKTDSGNVEVHVGPSSYISQKQFSFVKGDALEVVGSRITLQGKNLLLAREITKDGKTLVLRNAQGVPEWSGGRHSAN